MRPVNFAVRPIAENSDCRERQDARPHDSALSQPAPLAQRRRNGDANRKIGWRRSCQADPKTAIAVLMDGYLVQKDVVRTKEN